MTAAAAAWVEANQRHLVAEVAVVRIRLQAHIGDDAQDGGLQAALAERDAAARDAPSAPALELAVPVLGLSPFERDVLAGAAAAELDADVARLCATAHGDPHRNQLSFALAQAIFVDPHWSALAPSRPLRALRLVELGPGPLPSCPLTIAERVLHHLFGIDEPDERLQPWLQPLLPSTPLPPSQRTAVAQLRKLWAQRVPPLVQVLGADATDRRLVVAAAAAEASRVPWSVDAAELVADPPERENWWRLAQRELLLGAIVLVVEVPEDPAPAIVAALRRIDALAGAVVVSAEASQRLDRPSVVVEVPRPGTHEQLGLWRGALAGTGIEDAIEDVVRTFDLGAAEIARIAACTGEDITLREVCRRETRPALDGLAQRVKTAARWADLVLPDPQFDAVHTIAEHARHRFAVAEAFGAGARGQGIIALFAGASGTGKTLAAEVIANELSLDLFRIDLSAVVSKWIGETEKHLRTILDAADRGSAVLLFDEADALFGKRSEVRDSHDRFANIEVGYLLQRLETYRGIALLTTNLRSALDSAFARRIRYVVQFPYPDTDARERIWRRAFPPDVALDGLAFERLALLDLNGGSIHNIAVHAALDAAAQRSPVTVEQVRRGALQEYAKLDRSVTEIEAVGLQ
jgi:hypothetical protein